MASTTVYLRGPHVFRARMSAGGEFAVLEIGDDTFLYLFTEECDALAAAAFTAKSLLNGDNQKVTQ